MGNSSNNNKLNSSAESLYLFLHKTDSQVLGIIASLYLSSSVFSLANASVIPSVCRSGPVQFFDPKLGNQQLQPVA
jgi:hypothetical protein